jgi:hypothetical protein
VNGFETNQLKVKWVIAGVLFSVQALSENPH